MGKTLTKSAHTRNHLMAKGMTLRLSSQGGFAGVHHRYPMFESEQAAADFGKAASAGRQFLLQLHNPDVGSRRPITFISQLFIPTRGEHEKAAVPGDAPERLSIEVCGIPMRSIVGKPPSS